MKKPTKKQEREAVLISLEITVRIYERISGEDPFAVSARIEYKKKIEDLIARANKLGLELTMEEPFLLKMQLREAIRSS